MDDRSHGQCSLSRLAIGAAAALVVVSIAATPAASHGGHDDTGVHSNYLVIVRKPYQYDTNVYKNVSSWHASLVASVCDKAKEALEEDPASVTRIIYSYRNVVNGFSARLTTEEVAEMSKMDWFVQAFPEKTYQLLTTHTPQLLGLMGRAGGVWNTSNMGEGIIIGILDDGIYAGHPSLDGRDMKPPPARWNGRCDFNKTVCNNKLIGARSFFESAKWKWKGLRDPLGNGVTFDGESLTEPNNFGAEMRSLVRDVGDGMCTSENVLRAVNVTGKIIICDPGGDLSTEKAKLVRRAGAAGMIVIAPQAFGLVIIPRPHVLPTVQVPFVVGQKIKAYIRTMQSPAATFVFQGTVFNTPQSPMVAPFSSRGPNRRSRGILKPDIIGPGVNVLAGVPKVEDVEEFASNTVMPKFDIKSGTSMAAPHLSGIAALIKNAHPTWSPAAIKSAMMTTADTVDNLQKPMADADGTPATYYAMGAGHVNPQKAMDPGLVYNLTAPDYVPYLCGLGYTDQKVNSIIHPAPPVECAKLPKLEQKDLNYPSITAVVDRTPFVVDITRSVTNVGVASSTYAVEVNVPASVTVEVKPPTLTFKALEEVLSYTITIKSTSGQPSSASTIEGQLKWVSGNYVVRSPILICPGAGTSATAATQPVPQT
ncbi:hypothetical protein ABZP36_003772 [Zizania latifolia]